MIPPPEAIAGGPLPDGEGNALGMLDMARCALFVYVDTEGAATAQAADGVPKQLAAQWLRKIADAWVPNETETFRTPSGKISATLHPWNDDEHDQVMRELGELIEVLQRMRQVKVERS